MRDLKYKLTILSQYVVRNAPKFGHYQCRAVQYSGIMSLGNIDPLRGKRQIRLRKFGKSDRAEKDMKDGGITGREAGVEQGMDGNGQKKVEEGDVNGLCGTTR